MEEEIKGEIGGERESRQRNKKKKDEEHASKKRGKEGMEKRKRVEKKIK